MYVRYMHVEYMRRLHAHCMYVRMWRLCVCIHRAVFKGGREGPPPSPPASVGCSTSHKLPSPPPLLFVPQICPRPNHEATYTHMHMWGLHTLTCTCGDCIRTLKCTCGDYIHSHAHVEAAYTHMHMWGLHTLTCTCGDCIHSNAHVGTTYTHMHMWGLHTLTCTCGDCIHSNAHVGTTYTHMHMWRLHTLTCTCGGYIHSHAHAHVLTCMRLRLS